MSISARRKPEKNRNYIDFLYNYCIILCQVRISNGKISENKIAGKNMRFHLQADSIGRFSSRSKAAYRSSISGTISGLLFHRRSSGQTAETKRTAATQALSLRSGFGCGVFFCRNGFHAPFRGEKIRRQDHHP